MKLRVNSTCISSTQGLSLLKVKINISFSVLRISTKLVNDLVVVSEGTFLSRYQLLRVGKKGKFRDLVMCSEKALGNTWRWKVDRKEEMGKING